MKKRPQLSTRRNWVTVLYGGIPMIVTDATNYKRKSRRWMYDYEGMSVLGMLPRKFFEDQYEWNGYYYVFVATEEQERKAREMAELFGSLDPHSEGCECCVCRSENE